MSQSGGTKVGFAGMEPYRRGRRGSFQDDQDDQNAFTPISPSMTASRDSPASAVSSSSSASTVSRGSRRFQAAAYMAIASRKACDAKMRRMGPHDELAQLRPLQMKAVQRFASRCGQQRGFLVMHTMGSGKTFIGLAYMANFSQRFPKVVIVPDGLDTPWRTEMVNVSLTSKFQCSVTFLTYTQLSTTSPELLLSYLTNSIVVCDEAHILVRVLRGSNRAAVRKALKAVKHILLMTGTPIQTGWGDLGVLINVCDGNMVLPGTNKRFEQKFQHGNNLSREKKAQWRIRDTLMTYATGLTAGATQAAAAAVLAASGRSKAAGVVGLLWSGLSLYSMLYHEQKIEHLMSIDAQQAADAVSKYVSFFDYNLLEEDNKQLSDFPGLFQGEEMRVSVALTEFQNRQWLTNMRPTYRSSNTPEADLEVFADVDLDELNDGADYDPDWTDASTQEDFDETAFRLRMRALGNLSASLLEYTPVRMQAPPAKPSNMPNLPSKASLASVGNQPFQARARPPLQRDVPEHVFTCPKFEKVVELCMQARVHHHFLPVVYSNFKKNGIEALSAYLTSRDLPHIVIHPQDDPDIRKRLVAIANLPHKLYTSIKGQIMPLEDMSDLEARMVHERLLELTSNDALPVQHELQGEWQKKSDEQAAKVQEYLSNLVQARTQQEKDACEAAFDAAVKLFHSSYKKLHLTDVEQKAAYLKLFKDLPTLEQAQSLWDKNSKVLYTKEWTDKANPIILEYERLVTEIIRGAEATDASQRSMTKLLYMIQLIKAINNTMFEDTKHGQRLWDPIRDQVPFCVLLHPDIREGVGFDLAPTMVCLEVPDGIGNRDQIYARVLRSVNQLKRTLSFVDGTFLCGEQSIPASTAQDEYSSFMKQHVRRGWFGTKTLTTEEEANLSREWRLKSRRPWRVTKKVVQLISGMAPNLWEVPVALRACVPSLPKYFSIPDVMAYWWGENSDVYYNSDKDATNTLMEYDALVQRLKDKRSMQAKTLPSIVNIDVNVEIPFRFSLRWGVKHADNLSEAEVLRRFGKQSYLFVLWNTIRRFKGPSIFRLCTFASPLVLPEYLQFGKAWQDAVDKDQYYLSYKRYLKGIKNFSAFTADNTTFEINLKQKEQIDKMLRVFKDTIDDSTVGCVTTSSRTNPCDLWIPRATEDEQEQNSRKETSCTKRHDLVVDLPR